MPTERISAAPSDFIDRVQVNSDIQRESILLSRILDAIRFYEGYHAQNPKPTLFRKAGAGLVRLVIGDDGFARVEELTKDRTRYELARRVNFYKDGKSGTKVASRVPPGIESHFLAHPCPPFPVLRRLAHVPTFDSSGRLVWGHHPFFDFDSCVFFDPLRLEIPDLPVEPTGGDVAGAVRIVDELLDGVEFADDASRAHAVALLLQPFCRDLIDGPTPLYLIAKPEPGTGGSYLSELLVLPYLGEDGMTNLTECSDEAEWQRTLTAALVKNPDVVRLDNVQEDLGSGGLCSALTSERWSGRRTGSNELVNVPIRCTWVATANQPRLHKETDSRAIRIKILPAIHTRDSKAWASAHRGKLVWAALVLVQNWISQGRPKGDSRHRYDRWAATVSGILQCAGIEGFLGNADQTLKPTRDEEFLGAWRARFGDEPVKASDLLPLAQEHLLAVTTKKVGQHLARLERRGKVERSHLLDGYRQWRLL